ncbi:alpha/beta hydrolase [Actinomadura sp. NTSP31]|uniref:alpha/beta hydrolase n=1 Tax=Actinomadura sp. NTSP31 TaxID=1735447 RepID=UPI0035C263C1
MTTPATPVIFIHGLWLHATSWSSWAEPFRTAGYEPIAPGWPGDGETVELSRKDPASIADHGIDDVVAHYTQIITALDVKPILIGHSLGGMIAEKLLGQDLAAAAIDAAQIKGVLPLPPVGAALDPAGVQEPGQQAPSRLPHPRPVRQRRPGTGSR